MLCSKFKMCVYYVLYAAHTLIVHYTVCYARVNVVLHPRVRGSVIYHYTRSITLLARQVSGSVMSLHSSHYARHYARHYIENLVCMGV